MTERSGKFIGNPMPTFTPDSGLRAKFNTAAPRHPKSDMEQTLDGLSSFVQKLFIPLNILFRVQKPDGSYYDQSDLDRAMIRSGWMEEPGPPTVKINVFRENTSLISQWDKTQETGGHTNETRESAPAVTPPVDAPPAPGWRKG